MPEPSRSDPSRREVIGTIGAAAAAGGWLAGQAEAQTAGAGAGPVPYTLPALPYPPDALEPHIDGQTVRIHHDMHHAAYVKGLNDAIAKLDGLKNPGADLSSLRAITEAIAFNGSGHILHSIYWTNMRPGGSGPRWGLPGTAVI